MFNIVNYLTKKHKAKEFGYKPIYYNSEKKEFQERIDKLKEQMRMEEEREKGTFNPETYKPNFKSVFTSQVGKKRNNNISVFKSQLFRQLLILLALIYLGYWLFYTNEVYSLVSKFLNSFNSKNGPY